MATPPPPGNRLHIPGKGDPNSSALWCCTDCGAVLIVPHPLVAALTDGHRRGCVGRRLAAIEETLTLIRHELIGHVHQEPE